MSAGPTEPGSVPGPKVFITYRREETAAHAGRLYDAMVARFGEGNVFMDVELAPGVDFVERITEAVAACQVLIVVMGPRWATVEDEHGTVRIADPEDFVRLEVETALRRPDVTPIPVLVSGARMPSREDLPAELRAITRRNALELSDLRWRQDVGRLISTLDGLLGEAVASATERNVSTGGPAPADVAPAAEQSPAPPTDAATPSAEAQAVAPSTSGGRRLRWALLGAIAIAAIVAVAVLLIDGVPEGQFNGKALSKLVIPEAGNLLLPESGPGYPDELQSVLERPKGAYHNEFRQNADPEPYKYAFAGAAVFEDENKARVALDDLRSNWQGGFTSRPTNDLGEDGSVFHNTGEPEYRFAWRNDELLQVF